MTHQADEIRRMADAIESGNGWIDWEKDAAAMLRAYAEGVGGWRPIETAPKNGTHILGISGKYGVRETYYRDYGVGSPAQALFARSDGPRGAWQWEEPQNNWASSWCPAYWMPMPEHPDPSKIDPPLTAALSGDKS